MKCIIYLNTTFGVPVTTNITLELSGDTILHYHLERALHHGFYPEVDRSHFEFIRVNQFPTRFVQLRCDDFTLAEWSCQKKVAKCHMIMEMLGQYVKMMAHTLKAHHKYEIIGSIRRVNRLCSVSTQLKMQYEDRTLICTGPERLFIHGRQQCQIFFKCVDRILDTLTKYDSMVEECTDSFGMNNSRGIVYGFSQRPKEEYVKKKIIMEAFPTHFLAQCAGRTSSIFVVPSHRVKDEVICGRTPDRILKSIHNIKNCHEFVKRCTEIFDCLQQLRPCQSARFGRETSRGFAMENVQKYASPYDLPPCDHWAVKITVEGPEENLFCSARQVFRVKSMGFCESYEWVCHQLLRCLHDRKYCHYYPNKAVNYSITEDLLAGILDFQMNFTMNISNPRDLVKPLYNCNLRYGYPHFIHMYFITVECREKGICDTNVFREKDVQKLERRHFKLLSFFGSTNPLNLLQTQNHMTLWACKREALSSLTCLEFLRVCDEIKHCMMEKPINLNDSTTDLTHDDTCYSPLPVSTINPNPLNDVGGRGYFPGILGPSLSYTLPLKKPYPRVFKKMQYTGNENFISQELKVKRTNLFFDLFMEDCRYKHGFEGFLIEPIFTDTIDYLICSIPFGSYGFGENPLITQGCSHMKQTCENMKACYIHHADYFGFHAFFNENVLSIAIAITVVSVLTLFVATMDLCFNPVPLLEAEHIINYFLYICLGVTGSSMIAFNLENTRVIEATGTSFVNESLGTLPILRLIWHLSSFFLTLAFHLFTVGYTMR